MAAEWFYLDDARQAQGPVTLEALRELGLRGQVRPETLVWKQGFAAWAEMRQVPEIFGGAAAPPPPQGTGIYQSHPPQETGGYAGFWRRFAARLLDGIIVTVMSALVGCVTGGLIGGVMGAAAAAQNQPLNQKPLNLAVEVTVQVISLIVAWLYYALMESSSKQATLGKMALGIKVTDLEGRRIGFGRATGRYFSQILSALLLCMGFIMAGFTARKQALHDMIAGTLVVKGS